jgi:2-keto-4-pentenoate hydratase
MTERTLDDGTIAALADRLTAATASRSPVPPLTAEHPDMSPADAYAIQQRIVGARLEAGERVVGWKLGLTSRAMQAQLGVDQPDYGPILTGYVVAEGQPIPTSDLIAPRAEAEIAVILGRDLRGPGVTALDALGATAGIAPAIEIIDSRIADWKIRLADTIADLASSARVVLGGRLVPLGDLDLRLIGTVLEKNGEVVQTGAGAAALGNPAEAVAWAANTLGELGVTLEAGQFIMTGALHASVPAAAGDTFRASFDRLGSVTVRFA